MNKQQKLVLLGAGILFAILYFGFDTLPPEQKDLEKSRSLNLQATSIQNLSKEAREQLTPDQNSFIEALNIELNQMESDSAKIALLERLSGTWYEYGFPTIAGYYAEEIAGITNTEQSWSIAGTTYALALQKEGDKKVKDFSFARAVESFEKAQSLNPSNLSHAINKALIYVEYPQENPMEGILMLRQLNEKNPENVQVMNQLARLAIQTNQIGRAIERLEKAVSIEPDNKQSVCLLAQAYKSAGNEEKAAELENKCISLSNLK